MMIAPEGTLVDALPLNFKGRLDLETMAESLSRSATFAAPTTSGAVELWLAACLVPPAVMLLVWRGAPPVTVAELLHDVSHPGKAGPK